MKPEQKANELIEKFRKVTSYQYQEYAGAHYSTFEHDIGTLKDCAIICVDEMLEETKKPMLNFAITGSVTRSPKYIYSEYWQEVKQQLKLK